MPWIETHQTLRGHRKVLDLSERLAIEETTAIGIVVSLWLWAIDNAPDGVLPANPKITERALGWKGDDGALLAALTAAGFLDDHDGALHIHDFHDYIGRLIDQRRAQAVHRKRARALYNSADLLATIRARDGDRCRYCGVAVRWSDRKGPLGATYDHVDPDGPNSFANVVVACRGCNSSKRGRTPAEAGMSLLSPLDLPGEQIGSESGVDHSLLDQPIPSGKHRSTLHNTTKQNERTEASPLAPAEPSPSSTPSPDGPLWDSTIRDLEAANAAPNASQARLAVIAALFAHLLGKPPSSLGRLAKLTKEAGGAVQMARLLIQHAAHSYAGDPLDYLQTVITPRGSPTPTARPGRPVTGRVLSSAELAERKQPRQKGPPSP